MGGLMVNVGKGMKRHNPRRFTPPDLSSLSWWVDAELSAKTYSSGSGDGGLIATVADLSPNGFTFSDEGAANKFVYHAAGYNGKPAMRMNGSRAVLSRLTGALYSQTGSITVFFRLTSLPMTYAANPAAMGNSSANTRIRADNQYAEYVQSQAAGNVTVDGDVDDTTLNVLTINYISATEATMTINGVTQSFDPNNNYYANSVVRLGGLTTTTDAHPIEIYTAFGTSAALTTEEIAKIYDYRRRFL